MTWIEEGEVEYNTTSKEILRHESSIYSKAILVKTSWEWYVGILGTTFFVFKMIYSRDQTWISSFTKKRIPEAQKVWVDNETMEKYITELQSFLRPALKNIQLSKAKFWSFWSVKQTAKPAWTRVLALVSNPPQKLSIMKASKKNCTTKNATQKEAIWMNELLVLSWTI